MEKVCDAVSISLRRVNEKPGHDMEVITEGMVASRITAFERLGRHSAATMHEMVPDVQADIAIFLMVQSVVHLGRKMRGRHKFFRLLKDKIRFVQMTLHLLCLI